MRIFLKTCLFRAFQRPTWVFRPRFRQVESFCSATNAGKEANNGKFTNGKKQDLESNFRKFNLWRLDDNNNKFLVKTFNSKQEADEYLNKLHTDHRQMYSFVVLNFSNFSTHIIPVNLNLSL